jgi:hypothetical protein
MQGVEIISIYVENIQIKRNIWTEYFSKGLINAPLQCPNIIKM